jgi:hypothetical protein
VFENRTLKIASGPQRDQVIRDWRKKFDELYNFDSLPNFIKTIKSNSMRWTVHVVGMGEIRNAYKVLVGRP